MRSRRAETKNLYLICEETWPSQYKLFVVHLRLLAKNKPIL